MTFSELQIQLDLNSDNRVNILKNVDICRLTRYGYIFVDQEDGQCYLFDEDGQEDDINKVKSINDWAFCSCTSLVSISIPDSIENIGNSAFEGCTALTSISIPDSVKSIGNYAFFSCASLTNIKIPNSVESIGDKAFAYCTSLTSIEIPDLVESIGYKAFNDCVSLKEVVFKGKTIDEVKAMSNYLWGIEDIMIIKTES